MERQLSKEPETEEEKKTKSESRKTVERWLGKKTQEDESECKKTQAQRLFEFELWTDSHAIRDLEYSQRRTEKKQRQQERKKATRNRRWKKMYIPSMLAMLGGTILTLCGTLRSLGGDSVLWEARGVLIIVGPVILGLGFLSLMLAAGCTFEHDQQCKEESSIDPFADFLLHSFQDQAERKLSRPSLALRSISMDTADLPIPEDLDPSKNFMLGKPGWAVSRTVDRNESTSSTVFLDGSHSYNSTASWVRSVSASHTPRHALTRQNSDSNLLAGRGEQFNVPRRSLQADYSEVRVPAGSCTDLPVVCTRSLTSSGYQSASDSTTGGAADNHLPSDSYNNAGVDVVFTSSTLRHASRHLPSDAAFKTVVHKASVAKHCPDGTMHQRHHRAMAESGVSLRPGHSDTRGYRTLSRNLSHARQSSSSVGSSVQDRWRMALAAKRNDPNARRTASFSSYTGTHNLPRTSLLPCSCEGRRHDGVEGENTSHCDKPPVALEPIVYTVKGNRCTEV